MNGEDRISIWLRDAETHRDEEGMSELGDIATIDPITPPRRVVLPEYYEEASPTNTSFSDDSVFDKAQSPGDGWIEDVFCDDVPDKDPIDNENKEDERNVQKGQDTDLIEAQSQNSYDPPSEATGDVEVTASVRNDTSNSTTSPLLSSGKLRPTWLTSCAQCIYADLPCSRSAPACSRCRRKGQATLCLLHRRPYPEEILDSNTSWATTVIPLKLITEDEESWKAKLELAEKLRRLWQAKIDRKNWVLPSVESPRGGFRSSRTQAEKLYPGEGRGERGDKRSYQELCVVTDG